DDDQRRKSGTLDRPRRRREEQRWDRDLSRCALFPNLTAEMVTLEQGRSAIRICRRRRGQHTLRLLGMEVTPIQAFCGPNLPRWTRRAAALDENVRLFLRMFV